MLRSVASGCALAHRAGRRGYAHALYWSVSAGGAAARLLAGWRAVLVRQLSRPRDVTARAARTRPLPAARSVRPRCTLSPYCIRHLASPVQCTVLSTPQIPWDRWGWGRRGPGRSECARLSIDRILTDYFNVYKQPAASIRFLLFLIHPPDSAIRTADRECTGRTGAGSGGDSQFGLSARM